MSQEQRNSVERHKFCDHCGRVLTIEESLTYIIEDNKKRYLCEWDRSFISDVEADKQRINIVIWALHASDIFNYPWV
jgi:hypothetical protein